jgi:hypothetical protein
MVGVSNAPRSGVASDTRARLVVAQRSAAVGGKLLDDEGDDIFQAFELALVPAADVLNAAAPVVVIYIVWLIHDKSQQKRLNAPSAHAGPPSAASVRAKQAIAGTSCCPS